MRTVGVEEELLLVDALTGAPRAVATTVLERCLDEPTHPSADEVPGGTIDVELQQQQIEVDTTPTQALADLDRQISRWRAEADALAQTTSSRVVALATSPLPVAPEATPKARYQAMADHFGLTTTEQLTCGCHVHVGIASPEEGVAVLDRIRVWLPTLLALSANSPYWQGQDSGYASFRSQAWQRFPSAGPTDCFGSYAGYRRATEALVASGVLLDRAMIYYDARLSERYATVEIRVADVCLRAEDTVLVAALARALVETAAREAEGGGPAPTVSTEVVRLAPRRAGRSGLGGDLLDPRSHRPRPAAVVVDALLAHVRSALRASGDADRVDQSWARLQARGTGATSQRAWAAEAGLAAMVRRAIDATQGCA